MKRNILKIIGGTILTFAVISIITYGVVTAQDKSELQTGGGRLEGTWDARVSITNCQNGDVRFSFNSIANFMLGGTLIGSTAGMPQSNRTPEHGVWSHIKGNTYAFRSKTFSFNAQNAPTGWTIIKHEIVLDSSGDAYTSSGTAEYYDPDGILLRVGCSTAVGTRFRL